MQQRLSGKIWFESYKQAKVLLSALGNPIVDICVDVAEGYIRKWELEPNACINADDRHKELFNEIQQYFKVKVELGGCALNTLRIFQWLSGKEKRAS